MSKSEVSSKWSHLAELSKVVKELSERKCVKDLEDLFKHVEMIQEKVREQEATIKSQEEMMLAKSDEVIRLKKEHKDRQEEVIEFHTNHIRKKDDEKTALNQALSRQAEELTQAKTVVQHLEEHIQLLEGQLKGQDAEGKKIESQLSEARSKTESLDKNLKDIRDQMKSKDQQLQAEKKAHGDLKTQAEKLNKQCTDLQGELKTSNSKLKRIDDLAPSLVEDNAVEV